MPTPNTSITPLKHTHKNHSKWLKSYNKVQYLLIILFFWDNQNNQVIYYYEARIFFYFSVGDKAIWFVQCMCVFFFFNIRKYFFRCKRHLVKLYRIIEFR